MMATRARRVTSALIAALALLVAGAHGATATADGPIDRNPGESVYGTQTRPLVEVGPLWSTARTRVSCLTRPRARPNPGISLTTWDPCGSTPIQGAATPTNMARSATGSAHAMPGIPAMYIKMRT